MNGPESAPIVNPLAAWMDRHPEQLLRVIGGALHTSETLVSKWRCADPTGKGKIPIQYMAQLRDYTRGVDPADFVDLAAWDELRTARRKPRKPRGKPGGDAALAAE